MSSNRHRLNAGRRRGFTLVEIMIVVGIVTILSFLAAFVIGKIKQRAAHSLLQNNLRQLYQAKEYYFTESGAGGSVGVSQLIKEGYLKASIEDRLFGSGAMETKMGWHYGRRFVAGEPTYAYQGAQPTSGNPPAIAEYYPGQPTTFATVFPAGTGQTPIPSQPTVQPPVIPQPPPGFKVGSTPNAPWVVLSPPALPPIREDSPKVFSEADLLKLIGAINPAGGTPAVTDVKVDPTVGTVVKQANGSWVFTPAANFHGSNLNLEVKVANAAGETTATARFNVTPVTDAAQPRIGVSAEQQVVTTGPASGLGRIQVDRVVTAQPLNAMTLEFTVIGKSVPDTGASSGPVVVNIGENRGGNNNLLSLWNPGNMKIGGAGDQATGINLGDGQSHRVTLTWDSNSGNLLVYDNGALKTTVANYHRGTALPADLYAVLGGKMNNPGSRDGFSAGEHYEGSIFNTALSTQALTPEQVKAGPLASQVGPANGLVLDVRAVGGQIVDSTGIHTLNSQGLGIATVQVDTSLGANPPPGSRLQLNINPGDAPADPADRLTGVRVGGFPVGTVLSDGQGHTHTVRTAAESVDLSAWTTATISAQLPAAARDNFQIAVESTTTGPDGSTATATSTSAVQFTNAPRT